MRRLPPRTFWTVLLLAGAAAVASARCKHAAAGATTTKDELVATRSGDFFLFYPVVDADNTPLVCEVYCNAQLGSDIKSGRAPAGPAPAARHYCSAAARCMAQASFAAAWAARLQGRSSYTDADLATLGDRIVNGDADVGAALDGSAAATRLLLAVLPLVFHADADPARARDFTAAEEARMVSRFTRFYRASKEVVDGAAARHQAALAQAVAQKLADATLLKSRVDQVNDLATQPADAGAAGPTPSQQCAQLSGRDACLGGQEQWGCTWQRLGWAPGKFLGSYRCVSLRSAACEDVNGMYHLCELTVAADGSACAFTPAAEIPRSTEDPAKVGTCAPVAAN